MKPRTRKIVIVIDDEKGADVRVGVWFNDQPNIIGYESEYKLPRDAASVFAYEIGIVMAKCQSYARTTG
jgi:hypothetical protein